MGFHKLCCIPLGAVSLAAALFLAIAPASYGSGGRERGTVASEAKYSETAAVPPDSADPASSFPGGAPATESPNRQLPPGAAQDSTLPATVDQGDCLLFTLPEEARAAFCILYGSSGKPIARAQGFSTPLTDQAGSAEKPIAPSTVDRATGWAFIIAVPATAKAGTGCLETLIRRADGSVTSRTQAVTISEKEFNSEEIRLNKANAAIRSDTSPERMRQIDRLNDILFRFNPDATRYYGPWILPVGNVRRSAHFSDRRVYVYPKGGRETSIHNGVDFAVPRGTPVFSSGDGRVVLAESRISTGLTIVIEHLPGTYSLYYHLDSLAAAEGESVRAGTLIGHSGNTGLSTGPHLHWEFRVNGVAVSPDWFLSANLPRS